MDEQHEAIWTPAIRTTSHNQSDLILSAPPLLQKASPQTLIMLQEIFYQHYKRLSSLPQKSHPNPSRTFSSLSQSQTPQSPPPKKTYQKDQKRLIKFHLSESDEVENHIFVILLFIEYHLFPCSFYSDPELEPMTPFMYPNPGQIVLTVVLPLRHCAAYGRGGRCFGLYREGVDA